jgi:hypothetical protein
MHYVSRLLQRPVRFLAPARCHLCVSARPAYSARSAAAPRNGAAATAAP